MSRSLALLPVALLACRATPADTADTVLTEVAGFGFPEPTALAIVGDRVVAVGEDALALVGPETEVVSLDGLYVVPGTTDAHTHLLAGSFVLDKLLLQGVTSMDAIVKATAAYVARAPDVPWIVGYGWIAPLTQDADGRRLDEVVPDRPAVLFDGSGHAVLVNSEAMARAGITADTPDPSSGRIVRDEHGEPTGLLQEAAIQLVAPLVLDAFGDDALGANLARKAEEFLDVGITGVAEVLAVPGVDLARPRILATLEEQGRLPLRVNWFMPAFSLDDLDRVDEVRDRFDGDLARFVGVKIWVDGTTSSGEAWSLEPAVGHPDHFGLHYFDAEHIAAFVRAAETGGWHLKAHTNGDAAVEAFLDALETVDAELGGLKQRYSLEHAVLISPTDYARLAAFDVTVSVQPLIASVFRFSTQHDLWDDGRFDRTWDFRGLLDAGVELALGTDWPVPLTASLTSTLSAAVGASGIRALDMDEALRGYTYAPAYAIGREDELGCLDVGCLADLVVLPRDPHELDTTELAGLAPAQVWVGGRRVR